MTSPSPPSPPFLRLPPPAINFTQHVERHAREVISIFRGDTPSGRGMAALADEVALVLRGEVSPHEFVNMVVLYLQQHYNFQLQAPRFEDLTNLTITPSFEDLTITGDEDVTLDEEDTDDEDIKSRWNYMALLENEHQRVYLQYMHMQDDTKLSTDIKKNEE
jgi:hypothetical protein